MRFLPSCFTVPAVLTVAVPSFAFVVLYVWSSAGSFVPMVYASVPTSSFSRVTVSPLLRESSLLLSAVSVTSALSIFVVLVFTEVRSASSFAVTFVRSNVYVTPPMDQVRRCLSSDRVSVLLVWMEAVSASFV